MTFTHTTDQKLLTSSQAQANPPPPAYVHDPTLPTSMASFGTWDDGDNEVLSPIYLRINTPLVVNGDNNLVAYDSSIAVSKITMAAVSALRQMSMIASGVPMIDEEGRPRPIKVEVMTETRIEGSRNVIGEKAVVAAIIGGGGLKRKASEGSVSSIGSKRRRAESEPIEGDKKRVRTE